MGPKKICLCGSGILTIVTAFAALCGLLISSQLCLADYHWDFADGTPVVDGQIVSHAYTAPGAYNVNLTVSDDCGGNDSSQVSVQVVALTPRLVDYLPSLGKIRDVAITHVGDRTLACLASEELGLVIVDVSNPQAPALVSNLRPEYQPHWSSIVAASGTLVALGEGTAVSLFDISNPEAPILLAEFPVNIALSLEIFDGYVYVARAAGLWVIDSATLEYWEIDLGDFYCEDVAALNIGAETWAFAGSGWGLRIIKVTDPRNPIVLSQGGDYPPGCQRLVGFYAQNGVPYVYCIETSSTLHALDVSNPYSVSEAGTALTAGNLDIAVEGNYLVTSNYDPNHIRYFDISDPTSPVMYATYSNQVPGVVLNGGLGFLAGITDGLVIVDVTDWDIPLVGQLRMSGGLRQVKLFSNKVVVGDNTEAGLRILELSPSGHLSDAGLIEECKPTSFDVVGSTAYATCMDLSFKILDLESLSVLASVPLSSGSELLSTYHFNGDDWVLLNDVGGMKLVKVTDPAAPEVVSVYAERAVGAALRTAPSGRTYVYWHDGSSYLHVLDITNPANPQSVGIPIYTQWLFFDSMFIANDLLWLSHDGYHTKVYSLTNPEAPSLEGAVDKFRNGYFVGAIGYVAVKGYNYDFIRIIDYSNLANPVLLGTSPPSMGDLFHLALSGRFLVASDSGAGVAVYDLYSPEAAR